MKPLVIAALAALAIGPPSNAATCESLTSLTLPDTTITLAAAGGRRASSLRPAGTFVERGPAAPPVLQGSAGVLPRGSYAEADERFRHQDRSLASGFWLER